MAASSGIPDAYGRALARLGASVLRALEGLEAAERRLHPPDIPLLREGLGSARERLAPALRAFEEAEVPVDLAPFHAQLAEAAGHTAKALDAFLDDAPRDRVVACILEALRERCRAERALYPLRQALLPVGRHFVEPAFHGQLDRLDPAPTEGVSVGIYEAPGDRDGRGGFTLYVPESYDGSRAWPLVVALHGGSGRGDEFLWTWLREARGRRFLLLAPTSGGSTWSLDAPARDGAALESMLGFVRERWRVDEQRVLATGLSDGATFALLWGLGEGSPATAIAVVSGVLHPANFALGNLGRARGRRVYLAHGSLDWLFPVSLARLAREALSRAGADLVYREIEDLSHTYPRDENDRILAWFDASLALPGARQDA
ncbi:MAG TPA: phospholipase [Myxococcota bacterium]|nr:phospholipase [Myxococcota bacterium]